MSKNKQEIKRKISNLKEKVIEKCEVSQSKKEHSRCKEDKQESKSRNETDGHHKNGSVKEINSKAEGRPTQDEKPKKKSENGEEQHKRISEDSSKKESSMRSSETKSRKPKRVMEYMCQTCKGYFQLEADLTKHIDRNHVTDIRKQCYDCQKRFNDNYSLSQHKKREHSGQNNWDRNGYGQWRTHTGRRHRYTSQYSDRDNYYPC